jgi:hypothetical protein
MVRRGVIAGRAGTLPRLKADATPIAGMDVGYAPKTGFVVFRARKGQRVRKGETVCEVIDPCGSAGTEGAHASACAHGRSHFQPAARWPAGVARHGPLPHRREKTPVPPQGIERPGRLSRTAWSIIGE